MKCTEEELEERKQKQKEAQKKVDEIIAARDKEYLDKMAKLKEEASAKKAAGKPAKKAP